MENNRKRPYVVVIHLTQDECDELNQNVSNSGLSRESYLRTLINGYVPSAKPHEDFLEVIRQLRYIGNNLNQLAIVANKTKSIDHDLLEKELSHLKDCIGDVREKVYLPRRIE